MESGDWCYECSDCSDLNDTVVVLTELDPPLLPPGPEPGAGGAGQDVLRAEGPRGQQPLRYSLGHGSGSDKTNLDLETHLCGGED